MLGHLGRIGKIPAEIACNDTIYVEHLSAWKRSNHRRDAPVGQVGLTITKHMKDLVDTSGGYLEITSLLSIALT